MASRAKANGTTTLVPRVEDATTLAPGVEDAPTLDPSVELTTSDNTGLIVGAIFGIIGLLIFIVLCFQCFKLVNVNFFKY